MVVQKARYRKFEAFFEIYRMDMVSAVLNINAGTWIFIIPPALWATGGLEAPSFQESFFPEPLFPLGRGFNPFPTPPRGSWAGGFLPGWTHFGAPEPFQDQSKNHSFFDRISNPFCHHFCFQNEPPKYPKTLQNQQKVSPSMKKTNF